MNRIISSVKFLILAVLIVSATRAMAAVNSVASLANPMDNAGASARAQGMGSAFVGVADDSSALFWNPAGLGSLPYTELALHHDSWLAGILEETAVLGMPMGDLGGFGASLSYVDYGSLPGYDANGSGTSDYSADRYGIGVGWGKQILPELSAGASLKGSMQSVAGSNYSDIAADLGLLWLPIQDLRVGLAYSNLGTQVANYGLTSDLSLGASYNLKLISSNQLLVSVSGIFEPQGVNSLQAGAEDIIRSFLALRVGYDLALADTEIVGLTGLSAGLGLKLDGFSLDYAFIPYGDLGVTNRISLGYGFGQGKTGP
jgi:hypothetical protein